MLYPQSNKYRTVLDLSGFWDIKVDADDNGIAANWPQGFEADAQVAVPGSWNEQLAEMGLMNYEGTMWYQTTFFVPAGLAEQAIHIRVGAAHARAQVWVNGSLVGEHEGGFLPFEFDVSALVKDDANLLVICVNNVLTHDTIPQGCTEEDYTTFNKHGARTWPPTVFDFFNYGGIHRPVKVLALPKAHVDSIKVDTRLDGANGVVKFRADFSGAGDKQPAAVCLIDGAKEVSRAALNVRGGVVEDEFTVADCRPWSPEDPHLYQLRVQLLDGSAAVDEYTLDIGIREVKISGNNLMLNGKPIFLKGFGKHEDFPVFGKALCMPLIIKDFQMMKWIGANSFRTSHYPYAEEMMQMADKMGILVIDETPAVSLNFTTSTAATLENHKQILIDLVARDYNHPCVICWSVASEPANWGDPNFKSEKAVAYWKEIFGLARQLDSSRPLTVPACIQAGYDCPSLGMCDFIALNRYFGWYDYPGDIERAGQLLKEEMEIFHKKYGKPVFLCECGADAVAGEHSTTAQIFTEEYQMWLIEKCFDAVDALPYAIGEHVWNFAEFRTAQNYTRVVFNRKGVFDRQRTPKAAAFMIKNRWTSDRTPENLKI